MKLVLAFVFCLPLSVLAGGAVGNGGDTVYCEASPTNSFVGYYSLDYVVNKINGMQFADDFEMIVGPNDLPTKNFTRIIEAAKEYRTLVQDLKEFMAQIYANQYLGRYVWKKAPFGVVDIADEQLRLQIPPNCLTQDGNVIQTIFRVQKFWEMVWRDEADNRKHSVFNWGADFTYSNQVMEKMSSLQLSFLYFHEWLRNVTDDPEAIRDMNAIFHSRGWENGGADEKMDMIRKFKGIHKSAVGLLFKGLPPG